MPQHANSTILSIAQVQTLSVCTGVIQTLYMEGEERCDADNKEGTQRPELTKDEPPKLEYTDTKGGAGDSAAAERPAGHRSDADAGLRCLARRFTVLHPLASADALAQSSVCWSLRRVVCLRVQCSRKEITENGKFSTRSIGSRNTFHPRRLK